MSYVDADTKLSIQYFLNGVLFSGSAALKMLAYQGLVPSMAASAMLMWSVAMMYKSFKTYNGSLPEYMKSKVDLP